jgi:hypothetical protein
LYPLAGFSGIFPGFSLAGRASRPAAKLETTVLLSEVTNSPLFLPLCSIEERFFASLRMTERDIFPQPVQPAGSDLFVHAAKTAG